ncbi:MAG: sulfatase [Deltaproteobacteria bacterium]|nr:sulfatase [Deltaproteobacteria bacterium]
MINPAPLFAALLAATSCGDSKEPTEKNAPSGAKAEPSEASGPKAKPNAPHLILIVLDTVRRDHLSAYGYERDTSPNLKKLVARGVKFTAASSNAPWTHPAHASILSGLHTSRHGARYAGRGAEGKEPILRPGNSIVFLHQLLKQAGYATLASVGAPVLSPGFGVTADFDQFDGARPDEEPSASEVNQRLLARLDKLEGKQPLFALVNYYDAHSPYTARPEHAPWIDRGSMVRQVDLAQQVDGVPIFARLAAGTARLDPARQAAAIDNYDSEIARADAALGELIAALDERGLLKNAIVAITSDHGEYFGEHGLYDHGRTLYHELTDAPLVMIGPDVEVGRTVDAAVQTLDLFATFLEAAGLTIPAANQGSSLWPLLRGKSGHQPHPIAAEAFADPALVKSASIYSRDYRSLTAGSTKLIVSEPPAGKGELYDLAADSSERDNQAVDRPDDAALLSKALEDWLPSVPQARSAAVELSGEERKRLKELGYIS